MLHIYIYVYTHSCTHIYIYTYLYVLRHIYIYILLILCWIFCTWFCTSLHHCLSFHTSGLRARSLVWISLGMLSVTLNFVCTKWCNAAREPVKNQSSSSILNAQGLALLANRRDMQDLGYCYEDSIHLGRTTWVEMTTVTQGESTLPRQHTFWELSKSSLSVRHGRRAWNLGPDHPGMSRNIKQGHAHLISLDLTWSHLLHWMLDLPWSSRWAGSSNCIDLFHSFSKTHHSSKKWPYTCLLSAVVQNSRWSWSLCVISYVLYKSGRLFFSSLPFNFAVGWEDVGDVGRQSRWAAQLVHHPGEMQRSSVGSLGWSAWCCVRAKHIQTLWCDKWI
jgi:hypothetical protein